LQQGREGLRAGREGLRPRGRVALKGEARALGRPNMDYGKKEISHLSPGPRGKVRWILTGPGERSREELYLRTTGLDFFLLFSTSRAGGSLAQPRASDPPRSRIRHFDLDRFAKRRTARTNRRRRSPANGALNRGERVAS